MRRAAAMRLPLALRLALRELRGGLAGFRIFVACLALGVAAIAAVGSVRAAIDHGLAREASALLGGDAEIEFTYRFADPEERAWMDGHAEAVSEIVDFRSLLAVAQAGGEPQRTLVQVKAVDAAYPLYGAVALAGGGGLAEALAARDGLPGLVAEQALVDRLGLAPGAVVRLGTQDFRLAGTLDAAPDALERRLLARAAGDRPPRRPRGQRAARRGVDVRFVLPAAARIRERASATSGPTRWRGSAITGCNGATAAAGRRGSAASSTGWARSWCWSALPGLRSAGSGSPRRCGRTSTARPRRSRR